MESKKVIALDRLFSRLKNWQAYLVLHSWEVILLFFILCTLSAIYTSKHLGINTDTSAMLSPDLPFQINRKRLEQAFPQEANAIILVVDAPTSEQASKTTEYLVRQLKQKKSTFDSVYAPDQSTFFKQQGLLFLDIDQLETLSEQLTEAQPFIGHLAQNYSLDGLFSILGYTLEKSDQKLPVDIEPLLTEIIHSFEAALEHQTHYLSWQKLILGGNSTLDKKRNLILVKPKVNFKELKPIETSFSALRELIKTVQTADTAVTVRITGEKALEHEELESATKGTLIAGLVSFVLVCICLYIGLGSIKLLFATILTLIAGLILSAGYAAMTIGHLNLFSIAFAVLYIGLGVDFAIHVCLRYRELRATGMQTLEAILAGTRCVSMSLTLCAVTTAIGFFAFVPTDFSGVSELGFISGGSMFIGLLVSITLLPALLNVLPLNYKPGETAKKWNIPASLTAFPFHFSPMIRILAIILALVSIAIITQLRFDSNPVNLRDQTSESVSTFRDLLLDPEDSPYSLSTLAPDLPSAEQRAVQFEGLPDVKQAITLSSFVPEEQNLKLSILDDLALVLGNQLGEFEQPIQPTNVTKVLQAFLDKLLLAEQSTDNPIDPLYSNLGHLIKDYMAMVENSPNPYDLHRKLEVNLLGLLSFSMQQLKTSLQAYPFELEQIPSGLKQHWVSQDGLYRILIQPEKDLNNEENLQEFVQQVASIDDKTSGLPVADKASGKVVVKAFIQAFSGATIAITILIFVIFKNVKQTFLVIAPLLMAAVFTCATSVLLNNPFNYANIIALPLLLGMGVDSGIHMVHRLSKHLPNDNNILETSTARGIFFSALTTFCSFTSMAFIAHEGTASMGLLLATGIAFTLLSALVLIPAFSGQKIAS